MSLETYTCIDCSKEMPKSAERHHRCPPTEEWKARRLARLRRLLVTFSQKTPYVDNTAQRIIDWAASGWRGDP